MKKKLEELTKEELKFANQLKVLASVYQGTELTELVVVRYSEELSKVFKPNFFEIIVQQCIYQCRRFPSIAEILEVAKWKGLEKHRRIGDDLDVL